MAMTDFLPLRTERLTLRLLTPEDVARLTHFLLSPASEPMTGALIDQEQSAVGPRDA